MIIILYTKLQLFLYVVIVSILLTIIIGWVYNDVDSKRTIDETIETDKRTIQEDNETIQTNNITIETEIDKGDDTQAIEPVKDEVIFHLTDYERWVVECIVMGESGGEPYEGQVLVAQCILNACLKDNIQPSEVRKIYKYSGWNESPTDSVKEVVSAVFDLGEKIVDEPILYFYAPSLCQSKWHETQIFIIELGGHKFFKEKKL